MNLGGASRRPQRDDAEAEAIWRALCDTLGMLGTSEQLRLANSLRRGRDWADLLEAEQAIVRRLAAALLAG